MAELSDPSAVRTAEVVVPCAPLQPTLDFFTQRLGFKVGAIFPADSPRVAVLVAHGLTLRLQPGDAAAAGRIRLLCDDPVGFGEGATELIAPNGTVVELVDADPALVLPPVQQSLVINRRADDATFDVGRAGMQYRELIPGRQNGRFIGSHIRIAEAGPVPDYVHYHKVRFQMIYCHRGWVKVAYEDQGEPILMTAGDCVLQPPEIRHRVLESGDGLEVIELGCPAEHETLADRFLDLPTGQVLPDRDFGGQRFVFHVAAEAEWHPWRFAGWQYRDIGIEAATDGLAGVRVARPVAVDGAATDRTPPSTHDGEFVFVFVLRGSMMLHVQGSDPQPLATDDTVVIPAGTVHWFERCTPDLELLDVTLPAAVPFVAAPLAAQAQSG